MTLNSLNSSSRPTRLCCPSHLENRGEVQEPAPPEPQDQVFSFNPQDRRTLAPGTRVIPEVSLGPRGGPATSLVVLNEALEPCNGKYVYANDDPRQNTAIAFAMAAKTVHTFQEVFGEVKWAFKYDQLAINANGGKDLNAFYARNQGTVNFFQDEDPIFGHPVHSGASGEIVAHEVGHALLDGIRPEYLQAWRADVGAFHEAFSDVLAMHMTLMDERVIKRVAVQTGGDLNRPNIVAHMAEELAQAMNNRAGKDSTGGDFLRNANNQFTWAEPKSLPKKGGPNELGWSKHSFSRLWTGAHYDVLKAMVAQHMEAGANAETALRASNEELLKMTANLLREAPRGDFTFRDMAIAFVRSDKIHNQGQRAELIEEVFRARKILPEDLDPEVFEIGQPGSARLFQSLDGAPVTTVGMELGSDFGMFSGAKVEVPVSSERAIFHSEQIRKETREEIRRLIDEGLIRYNDPGVQMRFPQDYFNPKGELYVGAVTWEDGQMKIERLAVAD